MKKRSLNPRIAFTFAALLAFVFSITISLGDAMAASNKAVGIKVSFNGKKDTNKTTEKEWEQNTYAIQTDLSKKSKIKAKTGVSYKVVVPKNLLKKNGDHILFGMDLLLFDFTKKQPYIGMTSTIRQCIISKEGKKVSLSVYNGATDKEEGHVTASSKKTQKLKNASIKEQGNYYVITMKDVFSNDFLDLNNKKKKLNAKTAYSLGAQFVIHGNCSKLSGYIYLDEFTINAVKKQTMTFNNKKEYTPVKTEHFGGKNWNSKKKIVTLPF